MTEPIADLVTADALGAWRVPPLAVGEVWAPTPDRVELVIGDGEGDGDRSVMPMDRDGDIWRPTGPLRPGATYGFVLDGSDPLPDPRSRWQPEGVASLSRVDDPAEFAWTDGDWNPVPWSSAVIYELHVGTFSVVGTFAGVEEHLDHLVELGITHVELMPVNGFSGRYGWGYDGVCLWSPHRPYGAPDDLRHLVDRCHAVGLGVLIDVVYNHLGPVGNHLSHFGPYFTDRYRTPWGDAINLDGPGSHQVRAFMCGSSEMWLRDYHVDGLRIDAAHAFFDTSALNFDEQLARTVREVSHDTGRERVIVIEWDRNDPRIVTAVDHGGWGATAQWCDDLHHALHVALTGERHGYYEDYRGVDDVADTLAHAYRYRGQMSVHRDRPHGKDPAAVPSERFVVSLQTHDQVGNRARGERIGQLVALDRARAAAALVLLSPYVPMLFQGEEFAASTPFPYFADHGGELADQIREGRRAEFASFDWDPTQVIDPLDASTFALAALRWDEPGEAEGDHAETLAWYRRLLELRRTVPALAGGGARPVVRAIGGVIEMIRDDVTVFAHLGATDDADLGPEVSDPSGAPLEVPAPLGAPVGVPLAAGEVLASSGPVVLDGDRATLSPGATLILRG